MRPLRLQMTAFGPFRDQLTLDFTGLGTHSFFLIHGPTGAGKTTILDAICFALYGQTSGGDRDPRLMRCQQAADNVLTEVTLDFSLGQRMFRVTRQPQQDRPKKKGSGLTSREHQAWLSERSATQAFDAPGHVLAASVKEVNDKIVSLLGFQADQFRQVIVLPQGQFRNLLLAEVKDRQAILEKLFDAEKYRHLQEALKEAAKEARDQLRDLAGKRLTLLESEGAASEEELTVRIATREQELAGRRINLAELQALAQAARDRLQQAQRDLAAFEEAHTAQVALKNLEELAGEVQAQKSILEAARRAAPLTGLEQALKQRREEAAQAARRLTQAEERFREAQSRLIQAQTALDAEMTRKDERHQITGLIGELKSLVPRVEELSSLSKEKGAADKKAAGQLVMVQKARTADEDSRAAIIETERLLAADGPVAGQAAALRLEKERLDRQVARRCQWDQVKEKLQKYESSVTKARKKTQQSEMELARSRSRLEDLEKAWAVGQAALLAQGLIPGQPCPVCGSVDHPVPASADTRVPTEAALKEQRADIQRLEKEYKKNQDMEFRDGQQLTTAEAEAALLKEELRDSLDWPLAQWQALLADKSARLAEAEEAWGRLEKLQASLGELRDRQARTGAELAEADRVLRLVQDDQVRAAARYQAVEGQIDPRWRTGAALAKEIKRVETRLLALDQALEQARNGFESAGKSLAAATEKCTAAKTGLAENELRLTDQVRAWDQALLEAGFSDQAAYQDAVRPKEDLDRLESEILKYQGDLRAAGIRLTRARDAIRDLVRPDIPTLTAVVEQAETKHLTAVKEEAALSQALTRTRQVARDLKRLAEEISPLNSRSGNLARLSEAASGQNPANLTFQSFVLAALLDDVLVAASERLKIMSRGRYHLEREARGQSGKKLWGLDLRVFDSYTGLPRPVSTLSGGESFLAALSLALGLADVVQSYAGGMHMETIFIDEGFGSLDAEALDHALRALEMLQQGGRLVGVISHVPEMKERINTRLEIIPSRAGSSARFVVG